MTDFLTQRAQRDISKDENAAARQRGYEELAEERQGESDATLNRKNQFVLDPGMRLQALELTLRGDRNIDEAMAAADEILEWARQAD